MQKLPPIEKIFEAWTAIVDDRVKLNDASATVVSSDGAKEYSIRFKDDVYSSDDNATYWRGYPGYPVIAVLMLQGKLPYDEEQAKNWKNINWTKLNKEHRNNYSHAVEQVEQERHIDPVNADKAAREVMDKLEKLNIIIKRKI